MKRVFIIHGWDGSPNEPMHKWLKKNLELKGFKVKVPRMPNPEEPEIKAWVGHLNKIVKEPDKDTLFIGHSVGCQAVLRYLQTINQKVGGCVLIAPWMHLDSTTIKEEGEEVKKIAKPWMETPINWGKITSLTNKFVCIFSDDDPYVPLSDKEIFEKNLKAKIIVEHKKSHFDPGSNIKELPSALNSLFEISK